MRKDLAVYSHCGTTRWFKNVEGVRETVGKRPRLMFDYESSTSGQRVAASFLLKNIEGYSVTLG